MTFLDVFWAMIVAFALLAYLMVMFSIITDLFRDRESSGWLKAVWVLGLIFIPFLTSLVYLIAKGDGMAKRSAASAEKVREAQEDYVRSVAGTSPADQIAQAKALLDAGTIDQGEFDALKAKALA
ncbi:MAG: hypothetical protein CMH83_13345 [Nocardioides sp.]|nr:hypothetical protein [Nocardioides sp.]